MGTGGSKPQISPSCGGPGPLSNTTLLGTTRVSLPKGIAFRPTALAGHKSVTNDIQMDRPRCGNVSQQAELLLAMPSNNSK